MTASPANGDVGRPDKKPLTIVPARAATHDVARDRDAAEGHEHHVDDRQQGDVQLRRVQEQPLSQPCELTIAIPGELIELVARRVVELLANANRRDVTESPWLTSKEAMAYMNVTEDVFYKLTAARAIPCRKRDRGQGFLFRRDELDSFMEVLYPRVDRLG